MIGTLLNERYRIEGKLGEGGMGVVYKARDALLDRPVAIKSLSPELLSPDGLKRLLREAQSAAKLTHPGIVAIHDVIGDGDGRHIVMELVEGKTLREMIPMPWREAVPLIAQVFEAIDYAHNQGIVHRDLKPENIIITPEGRARVMDFGLARSEGRSRLTQTGLVVGTAHYMAPEQALQGKALPQSDLYGLGCVFYEVITGQPPFKAEDALGIITQHINLPPRTPRHAAPDLPPAIEAIILKLLAKDPKERPRSAGDVARMLALTVAPPVGEVTEAAAPAGALAKRLRRVRLVGRLDVLGRLMERLDLLISGTGGLVVLSGEPGIGKTRLLDEVVTAARVRGVEVMVGRCHERDIATPYLPIADAIEGFARRCPVQRWEELLTAAGDDIFPLLSDSTAKHVVMRFGVSNLRAQAIGTVLTRAEVKADSRAARAFRNLLTEVTQQAWAMFVADDLHWADPHTLELLHHLALYTREIPVLILGAYREVELDRTHPLSRLLVDLNRERLVTRERLRRFTPAETTEFLSALLNGSPPVGFAELVQEETEGNPFFIEELVNGLVEDGRLLWNEEARAYELAPGVTADRLAGEVPQGIRAAIGARLDRLEPGTQQVLTLAAVLGRHFSQELLVRYAAAHGLREEDVEDALSQAQGARFVTPLERRAQSTADLTGYTAGSVELEADYAFDHPLIHHVVYSEVDRRRRRRLHGELGYLLEQFYPGREGLYAERLAYHYLESDDDGRAVRYCLHAGDKMLLAYYDQHLALSYLLPALEMVISKEPLLRHLAARSPVAIRRGTVHRFTSEEREAIVRYLGEILQAVRGTSAMRSVAELASRICVAAAHLGEVYEKSIRLAEEALLGPNVEKLVVETAVGKLVGILEFPGAGEPYPVVMMLHGSGGGKEGLAEEARRYLARGMATLRVDLPGYGETTVPMTATLQDALVLKDMITAVVAHNRVDKRGLGIAGWSYGPWHGGHMAARDERVRALVSISGIFKLLDLRPGIRGIPKEMEEAQVEAQWKAGKRSQPGEFKTVPAETSVYEVADRITCPVLLVYGALEPEKFRAQAEELAAVVPTAKIRAWRTGLHVLLNLPEALEDAADWMKQQLLGPSE